MFILWQSSYYKIIVFIKWVLKISGYKNFKKNHPPSFLGCINDLKNYLSNFNLHLNCSLTWYKNVLHFIN